MEAGEPHKSNPSLHGTKKFVAEGTLNDQIKTVTKEIRKR
jgi:hypothetical protein